MRRPVGKESDPAEPTGFDEVYADLPLLHPTPRSWAELAAARLPEFLADHAVCEQQVAVYALSLAGYYPEDAELVERAAALAAEEVQHFRRVVAILRKRGWPLGARRRNVWAQSLRARIVLGREPWTKVDRLLFGAMIEARSCERFTRLLEVVDDPEVVHLLADPAERRHWQIFYRLASLRGRRGRKGIRPSRPWKRGRDLSSQQVQAHPAIGVAGTSHPARQARSLRAPARPGRRPRVLAGGSQRTALRAAFAASSR